MEENIVDIMEIDGKQVYYNMVYQRSLLSEEKERELICAIQNGDEEARGLLIESYLPLVQKIAKKFGAKHLDFLDLVQSGSIGLIKAVDNYDVTKGVSFLTYAFSVICYTIMKEMNNYERHASMDWQILIIKYRKAYELLIQKLQRLPIIEEIAEELGMSKEEVTVIYDIQKTTISLEEYVEENAKGKGDHSTLAMINKPEILGSNICREVEETAMIQVLPADIERLFQHCQLKDNEIKVLKLYYGLNGTKSNTLEEIGRKLNMKYQSIYRIKERALRKLRYFDGIESFAFYMDNPDQSLEYLKNYQAICDQNGNKKVGV